MKSLRSEEQVGGDSVDFAIPVEIQYAKGIKVNNYPRHKELLLLTHTETDTVAHYILYPRTEEQPTGLKPGVIPVAVPVDRIACLSTPQVGALSLLGAEARLVAAAKINYISSPRLQTRIEAGDLIELGDGISPNREAVLMARPEVMLQDFGGGQELDKVWLQAGVTPILFASWQEQSLLGRAEWLKVAGMLLGLNARADSLFAEMVSTYREAQKIVASERDTIPILYGLDYKGVWYVPGEYSYPTALFADAGVHYDYIPRERESKPRSFEYIYARHRHAKIWIASTQSPIDSKDAFISLNERYAYFDAAGKDGHIFLNSKRLNATGGNDYWESGPYRPDLLLKDFIKMTRPEKLPDHELYYFVELK